MLDWILALFNQQPDPCLRDMVYGQDRSDLISMYQESVLLQLELGRELHRGLGAPDFIDGQYTSVFNVIRSNIGDRTGKTALINSICNDPKYEDLGICVVSYYNRDLYKLRWPTHRFVKFNSTYKNLLHKIRETTCGIKVSLFIFDGIDPTRIDPEHRHDPELTGLSIVCKRHHFQQILILG